MAYYYSRKLNIPFEEAVQKVTQNLKQQGFGIITNIDLKDILKQKTECRLQKIQDPGRL